MLSPRVTRVTRHQRQPWPRRSSVLELSAETMASLNEDSTKLHRYRTAEDLIRSLEEDPPTP